MNIVAVCVAAHRTEEALKICLVVRFFFQPIFPASLGFSAEIVTNKNRSN